jgi:hypothetical protein
VFTAYLHSAGTWRFVKGALSRREFMLEARPYYRSLDFINRRIPDSERLMMVGAQMSYDLKCDYIADSGWDSVEWQRLLIRNSTLAEVNEDLKHQNVTHILYCPEIFRWTALHGREGTGWSSTQVRTGGESEGGPAVADYESELRNWSTFEMYRRKYLETVRPFDGYLVLRIR